MQIRSKPIAVVVIWIRSKNSRSLRCWTTNILSAKTYFPTSSLSTRIRSAETTAMSQPMNSKLIRTWLRKKELKMKEIRSKVIILITSKSRIRNQHLFSTTTLASPQYWTAVVAQKSIFAASRPPRYRHRVCVIWQRKVAVTLKSRDSKMQTWQR